ncbi:MAG TPA: hypothetical protein VGL77_07480 [Armatimonadota bacterium]|jgi:hypothetical protein
MRVRVVALLALSSLLGVLASPALAQTRPAIRLAPDGTHVLALPRAMMRALRGYDAHMVPWREQEYLPAVRTRYHFSTRQAPFAVIGDMNADGRLDVVLDGHNRQRNLSLCLLSRRRGYRVLLLSSSSLTDPKTEGYSMGDHTEYGLWDYLTLCRPGVYQSPHEAHRLTLTADAFQRNAYGKASTLYYYRRGRFHAYTTSD